MSRAERDELDAEGPLPLSLSLAQQSTSSSTWTWQEEMLSHSAPAAEAAVVDAIHAFERALGAVRRAVTRLRAVRNDRHVGANQERGVRRVLKALALVPNVALSVVVTIVQWRQLYVEREPYKAFVWNGGNYLVDTLPLALDFLDTVPLVVDATAMVFRRNPFLTAGGIDGSTDPDDQSCLLSRNGAGGGSSSSRSSSSSRALLGSGKSKSGGVGAEAQQLQQPESEQQPDGGDGANATRTKWGWEPGSFAHSERVHEAQLIVAAEEERVGGVKDAALSTVAVRATRLLPPPALKQWRRTAAMAERAWARSAAKQAAKDQLSQLLGKSAAPGSRCSVNSGQLGSSPVLVVELLHSDRGQTPVKWGEKLVKRCPAAHSPASQNCIVRAARL